jgi:hypothetical protein
MIPENYARLVAEQVIDVLDYGENRVHYADGSSKIVPFLPKNFDFVGGNFATEESHPILELRLYEKALRRRVTLRAHLDELVVQLRAYPLYLVGDPNDPDVIARGLTMWLEEVLVQYDEDDPETLELLRLAPWRAE